MSLNRIVQFFLPVLLSVFAMTAQAQQNSPAQPYRSFVFESEKCYDNLVWNHRFTEARCTVRGARTVYAPGAESVNFSLPVAEGEPEIVGSIRALSDGYVFTLRSAAPMVPAKIEKLVIWALSIAAPRGIKVPSGFCGKFVAEVDAIFRPRR